MLNINRYGRVVFRQSYIEVEGGLETDYRSVSGCRLGSIRLGCDSLSSAGI